MRNKFGTAEATKMEEVLAWRHYEYAGEKDVKDSGWGCVFRSVQNAVLEVMGECHVPTMRKMVDGVRHSILSKLPHGWIEPSNLDEFLQKKVLIGEKTACEAWRTPAVNANMFRKSGITEYTSKEPAEIIKSFVGSAESAPRALVLDDGVFGVCYIMRGDSIVQVDPHSTEEAQVTRMSNDDFQKVLEKGAMMLFVHKL